MKTKMFKGTQVSQVMTQIREEVGDDAFIVSMIESEGLVEVEVGIDDGRPPIRLENPIDGALVEHTRDITFLGKGSARQKNSHLRKQLEDLLVQHGVRKSFAEIIAKNSENYPHNNSSADKFIAHALDGIIECNSLIPQKSNVIAFCGATGVGKTTTIAKLASRLKLSFEMNIGLIAADTYRVGAGYHLQTYASILGLPFRQIQSTGAKGAAELQAAVNAFSKYDLVLIDTSGCGPREKGRIEDIQLQLSKIPEAEKLLVMPAPSNDFDLHASASSFDRVDCSRIVLSKVDETGYLGPAINTLMTLGKPLAFIATGQKVPEDIEPASNRRLAWMLTREMH